MVASVRVGGTPGAVVTLTIEDSTPSTTALASTADLIAVRVGAIDRRYSLADLARGVTIHEFVASDTVLIEYRILRGRSSAPSSTSRLVQQITPGAHIVGDSRMWVHPKGALKFLAPGTSCTLTGPGLICSDAESTAGMNPYYPAFDGFSSTDCCGQSVRMTITFNIPMSSVTVTAADPDFPGNTVTAFDASGVQLDQKSFAFDNAPGVLTYDTQTVTGDGITTIVLDAPIGEYVYYRPIQVIVGTAPVPPTITSVSPSPLVPGANATIVGTNFSATATANLVKIGGQQAKVVSSTTTQLSVVVPCTSSGNVDVTVTKAGLTTAPFPHQLQVAQQTLAVGQSVVLPSAAASECNELPSAGGPARYVMSVVNVDARFNTSTSFQVSADLFGVPGPSNGLMRAAMATRPPRSLKPVDTPVLSPSELAKLRLEALRDEEHSAFLKQNIKEYERLRARFGGVPEALSAAAQPASPTAPPLTDTFRVIDMAAPISCNRFYVSSATRVYYNPTGKVAIYEDDATATAFKAGSNPTMASYYTLIGDQFNSSIEPIIRDNFGDMLRRDATTDKNGVVILFFTPRIAQSGSSVLGLASSCDLTANDDKKSRVVGGPYTGTGTNGSSNRGEFAYLTLPTVTGSGYGGNTPDEWYRTIRSTVVHESKHLAAYAGRKFNNYAQESEWLEEGTARLAEELWMRLAVDNVAWKASTGFGNAAQPVNLFCDLQTTAPCASGLRPAKIMSKHFSAMLFSLQNPGQYSVFGGSSSVFYAEAWSLVRYSIDRYAPAENAFTRALTVSPDTGIHNLELRSTVTIGQLLGGRALSMYADHYPGLSGASPDMAFPTWNLRDIYTWFNGAAQSSTALPYPLVPTPLTFGSVTSTPVVALPGGSSTWYELSGTQSAPQLLRLEGSNGAPLPATLRLSIARLQ